jgi:hypothetical protein
MASLSVPTLAPTTGVSESSDRLVNEPRPSSEYDKSQTATWLVYATLFASLSIIVGLIWDISWHRTVGRDTFWTYPHVLEQIAAIVAGLGSGWLVLHTTFARTATADAERQSSVRVWGFRGPLGAWICIWGAVMMVTSAPFDNWWHNAYGLDVKIISPPHMVLAVGMVAIEVGALLIAIAAYNRETITDEQATATNETRDWTFGMIFVTAAGVIIGMIATAILERAGFANEMHSSFFYQLTACLFPLLLVACARGSSGAHLRWPATLAATVYMMITLIMMWVLQLFHATPMLAPIYNPVTHMVPPPFPFLLVVPAIGIDILVRRFDRGNDQSGRDQSTHGRSARDWFLAAAIGVMFLITFGFVQWCFADFLMSPHARNFFFGADQWDYNIRPGLWQHMYWIMDRGPDGTFDATRFTQGLMVASLCAIVSARAGLGIGNALRRVKR